MEFSRKYILGSLFVAIFLSFCQAVIAPELPDVGIERNKLNKHLEIAFPATNTYKIDEPIKIIVRLRSQIEIYTDGNFNARMFVLNKELGQWEEVYDPVTSYSDELNFDLNEALGGSDEFLLSPDEEVGANQLMVILHPEIDGGNKPVTLLIVLSGLIYENGSVTDQKVGAYSIVSLKP